MDKENYITKAQFDQLKIEQTQMTLKLDKIVAIVNPDNPLGNYLSKDDVISILEYCAENDKILVYDESFVDFTELKDEATLLSNEFLSNENLVI